MQQDIGFDFSADELPSWLLEQAKILLSKNESAWLLHGTAGLGQLELGMALAQAMLCEESNTKQIICGQCEGCKLIQSKTHPDLLFLFPEQLLLDLKLPIEVKALQQITEKKRKPSQEIKVDSVRAALDFTQTTASRGGVKVVLIYPAERMNLVTANTLLKTLEEPPQSVRFILLSQDVQKLLPTINSRCIKYSVQWPPTQNIIVWLGKYCSQPQQCSAVLRMVGGRPMLARQLLQQTKNLELLLSNWEAMPKALSVGELVDMELFSLKNWLQSMQKICYDLTLVAIGVAPRFFLSQSLPNAPNLVLLVNWDKWLKQQSKYIDRPYNANLFLETLVVKAQQVLSNKGVI